MNAATTRGIFLLIKSALTGKRLDLPEGFALETAKDLINKHQIGNMVYYGAVNCGMDPRSEMMRKLFAVTCHCLQMDKRQRQELNAVTAAFRENGIDHMPLKGILLKQLYPRPDMRIMSDGDILIRVEQYEKIKPLLLELGFAEKLESDHELIWEKTGVCLELHKRLIPSYNYDYAAYFGDGWRLAQPVQDHGCCYEMTRENQMIYLFTHFAKHYRDGGIGFRHLTDLYVYKNANPDLDEEYVLKELTLLQLDAFYKNICDALAVAFENKSGNEITDMILSFMADSGVYGTAHKHIIAAGAREKASGSTVKQVRRKHWMQLIVPSYSTMCEKYPVLKKLPVLLPVMWVVRWLAALFGKRQKIQSQSKKMQVMTEESIESYEQALHAVGLAFHFEE